jgi:transaldolase
MGASFRSVGEVLALCGCDRLTIAPKFLKKMRTMPGPVPLKLKADGPHPIIPRMDMTEERFRWMLNEDAMATEKLAEGIRRFSQDIVKLEKHVATLLPVAKL